MKFIIWVLFVVVAANVVAQENTDYFLLFDKEWKQTTNEKKSRYFIHVKKTGDSSWTWDYYNAKGPRLSTETYKDQTAKTPHGFFAYYDSRGYLDSCGNVYEKRKDGIWTYFRGDSGKVYLRQHYNKGILYKTDDYSKKDTPTVKEEENRPIVDAEVESEFPGGLKSWSSFLVKNLVYPMRAIDLNVQGETWVLFVVDANGKPTGTLLAKSIEYSLDEESLRIINMSPNWTPAIQNGKKVKSYKKQPIRFKLER